MKYVVCEKNPIGAYRIMGSYNTYEEAKAIKNGLKKEKPNNLFCIATIKKSYL